MSDLLTPTPDGLYCPAGRFYIDPSKKVDRAVITHGHSDHARSGLSSYLCAKPCVGILRRRLGKKINVTGQDYGVSTTINGVKVSFHPAGHVLGSAQVRVEHKGEVWVVTGDYKLEDDGISGSFEPVKCHTFITESTFGLPIYRWRPQAEVAREINTWWRGNQALGKASVIYAYSLGKAQRLQSIVDPSIGPICVYKPIAEMNGAYLDEGVSLPPIADETKLKPDQPRPLIVAPASTEDCAWLRGFGPRSTAFVSGWMRVRGGRRWGNFDRGFVMSDHVDWPDMLRAIEMTEAERVLVTHGYTDQTVRYLCEQGIHAKVLGE
ncbi:MAG: ligase-associated DNA damage response exonuclease [Limisphaerales bacterium]